METSVIGLAPHQIRVHIRWMIRRDMPEVLEIERPGGDHPWTEEDFLRHLRRRNCIGMVAERGERVVGFMVYELSKGRIDLANLAVRPEFRRRAVGRQMVAKLAGKLSAGRYDRITLRVRETALEAQLFFRACGFRATDVIPGHFEDSGEDAYAMSCVLPAPRKMEDGR